MRERTVSRRFECRVARARQVLDTRRRAASKRLCTTTSETRSRSKYVLSARRANSGDISSTSSGSVVQQQESVSTSQSPPSALSSNSSMVSQLVFSLSVVACALSVAMAGLLITFIPAIKSMKQAAEEIAFLARTLREEMPDTLATLRLSGVEISDCVEEIGELSNDLTRGLRTSARTIAATSGAVKEGAYYVKDNVYPVVKEKVVPAATSTMKTVLKKRADMNNYNKPVVAIAASRTAKVIKGIRSLIVAREVYNAVDGGQSEEDVNVRGGE